MKMLYAIALAFITYSLSIGQGTNIIILTKYGKWTPPPAGTIIFVECWGQGAPGGGGSNIPLQVSYGGGGGGGAYAASKITVPIGITEYHYAVNTGANEATTFSDLVKAMYGSIGQTATSGPALGGLGGQAKQCKGQIVYSGGNGGAGILALVNNFPNFSGGGGGGSAGPSGDGSLGGDASPTIGGLPNGQSYRAQKAGLGATPGGGGGGIINGGGSFGGPGMIRITY